MLYFYEREFPCKDQPYDIIYRKPPDSAIYSCIYNLKKINTIFVFRGENTDEFIYILCFQKKIKLSTKMNFIFYFKTGIK